MNMELSFSINVVCEEQHEVTHHSSELEKSKFQIIN